MLVKVLRYSLRHNGATYSAGAVADLPDDTARRLIQRDPRNYAAVGVSPTPSQKEQAAEPAKPVDLESMTVAQLRSYAADIGVKIPAKARRDVIFAIISEHVAPAELPTVDFSETVI